MCLPFLVAWCLMMWRKDNIKMIGQSMLNLWLIISSSPERRLRYLKWSNGWTTVGVWVASMGSEGARISIRTTFTSLWRTSVVIEKIIMIKANNREIKINQMKQFLIQHYMTELETGCKGRRPLLQENPFSLRNSE